MLRSGVPHRHRGRAAHRRAARLLHGGGLALGCAALRCAALRCATVSSGGRVGLGGGGGGAQWFLDATLLPAYPPVRHPPNETLIHCTALHRAPPPQLAADNPALYQHLVERLAHVLELRAQSDPQVCSGCWVLCSACSGGSGGVVWGGGAAMQVVLSPFRPSSTRVARLIPPSTRLGPTPGVSQAPDTPAPSCPPTSHPHPAQPAATHPPTPSPHLPPPCHLSHTTGAGFWDGSEQHGLDRGPRLPAHQAHGAGARCARCVRCARAVGGRWTEVPLQGLSGMHASDAPYNRPSHPPPIDARFPHPRPRPPSLTVPVPPRSRATPPAPSPACMQALKCGVVLVVGDERLFSQLSGDLRRADASIEVRGGGMGGRGGVWDVCVGGGRRP